MSWVLEYNKGSKTYKIKVSKTEFTIGRKCCDLCFDDNKMSSKHCIIYLYDDKLTIVDNSSTNGLFVNRKKVQAQELSSFDKITIGMTNLKVIKT